MDRGKNRANGGAGLPAPLTRIASNDQIVDGSVLLLPLAAMALTLHPVAFSIPANFVPAMAMMPRPPVDLLDACGLRDQQAARGCSLRCAERQANHQCTSG